MISPNPRSAGMLTMKQVATLMIIIFFWFSAVFARTWCGVRCRRIGYEIARERIRTAKLLDMKKKLDIERVHLMSPENLGRIAREELGLITPRPEQVISLVR